MTTKTCETCQAWREASGDEVEAVDDGSRGYCCLNPKRAEKFIDEFCMQHIPIKAECEHEWVKWKGCGRCWKCGLQSCTQEIGPSRMTPLSEIFADHPGPTQAEKSTESAECWHEFITFDGAGGKHCPKCGIGVTFTQHVDDHSPEAKLKDAYEKLGEANERIKELKRQRATALDDKYALNGKLHVAMTAMRDAVELIDRNGSSLVVMSGVAQNLRYAIASVVGAG